MDAYRISKKLLGVWVTTPTIKKNAIIGHTHKLRGVVDSNYLRWSYTFHDNNNRILGHPLNTDHHGNGAHNLIVVDLAPIWIGWTRDAGETFITDDDLMSEHGYAPLGKILKDLGMIHKYHQAS